MGKTYICNIVKLIENGEVILKGQEIKKPVTEERAKQLLNGGFISIKEEKKAEDVKKEVIAPINKMVDGNDTEKKEEATPKTEGKAKNLLNKFKNKKK